MKNPIVGGTWFIISRRIGVIGIRLSLQTQLANDNPCCMVCHICFYIGGRGWFFTLSVGFVEAFVYCRATLAVDLEGREGYGS